MQILLKQKSTEVQGEVQEELIEDFLRRKFPTDQVTPIKKGFRYSIITWMEGDTFV